MAGDHPHTAYLLALIGGILMVLEAVILLVLGSAVSSAVASELGLDAGALLAVLLVVGVVGLVLSLVVLYGAFQLKSRPGSSKTWGIGLIVIALIGLFLDNGFYLGFLLVLIAGILAYIWKPPMAAQPSWNPTPGAGGWGATIGGAPAGGLPSSPAASGQKYCAHCGSANVATATFCAHCGAALT